MKNGRPCNVLVSQSPRSLGQSDLRGRRDRIALSPQLLKPCSRRMTRAIGPFGVRGPANIKDACGGLISRLMSSSLSVSSSTFSGPLCLASFAPFFFRQALAEGAFDDLLLALVVERDRDGAVLPFFLLFHSSSHFPPLVSHLSHFCLSRRV